VTEARVSSITYHKAGAPQETFHSSGDEPESSVLKVSEKEQVHFSFQISFASSVAFFKPSQVGIILIHPEHSIVTRLVPARFNPARGLWECVY